MRKIFASNVMGGFECSTHINYARKRVDVINSTKHDVFAEKDFRRLLDLGIKTARDGVRWHLIEQHPFEYDFSSVVNQVRAARRTGMQIIWDLFHYGFPEDLDLLDAEFVTRFTAFTGAFVKFLQQEGEEDFLFCPLNEISFYSWIAGEVGGFYPFLHGRGSEVKRNLVRAAISASRTIKNICPQARLIYTDPAIHITSANEDPSDLQEAEMHRQGQYEAIDMLCGRREPELGGSPEYLDIVGVNYYSDNQWHFQTGQRVFREQPEYRPLHKILEEFFERYNRPILIAETGIEDEARPEWFRYVSEEVETAETKGIPIEGICLYPIVNHPGWDDERHCHNGLWDYPDEFGNREIYQPLADEIKRQLIWQKKISQKSENRNLQAKQKAA
ncbi:MAG: beta-glucosidase [Acidobacteriota bacterium]|nr:beta-glucosidase [Acidobacteriota bacterium]